MPSTKTHPCKSSRSRASVAVQPRSTRIPSRTVMLAPRNQMQHVLQATPRDGSKRTELEGRCRCLQILSTPSRLQTPTPSPPKIHPKIRNETMLGSTCLSAGNPCKASPVPRRVAREKHTGLIRPRRLRHTISGIEGQGYISTQNRTKR